METRKCTVPLMPKEFRIFRNLNLSLFLVVAPLLPQITKPKPNPLPHRRSSGTRCHAVALDLSMAVAPHVAFARPS